LIAKQCIVYIEQRQYWSGDHKWLKEFVDNLQHIGHPDKDEQINKPVLSFSISLC